MILTGGGKLICYQVPTMQFSGIILVISLLISLMKDQVDNLKTIGISATYINSSLTSEKKFTFDERRKSIEYEKLQALIDYCHTEQCLQ